MDINKSKDNPKLRQQKLQDGRISLYLEYYIGRTEEPILDEYGEPVLYDSGAMAGKPKYKIKHIRRKEVLKLYLVEKPKSPADRQMNREVIELAQRIRFEREQKFLEDRQGYRLQKDKSVDLYLYFDAYIKKYTKKDIRMVRAALRDFRKFISITDGYGVYKHSMNMEQLTPDVVRDFVDYLQEHHTGEGGDTVYSRFKKVIKYAWEHDVIRKNPCTGITIKVDKNVIPKDTLTPEEIQQLIATKYDGQNQQVRKAFIFSLFCGLRFCDVKELTYANIDYSAKRLTFDQRKTSGHSSASNVTIPISDSIIKMIGQGKRDQKIFVLPSHNACLDGLDTWVKRAGIDKHITWHCARHSFGLNILNGGANIKTVSSLLGHASLRHTEKYVRAVDKLKEDAIKSLGDFEL